MSAESPRTTDGTAFKTPHWEIERSGRDDLQLANSRVTFEDGPAGVIARVDHETGGVEYAGPLSPATIRALRDVAALKGCGGGDE